MHSPIALLAASAGLAALASAQCTETSGNWYCSETSAVTYNNFGGAGFYNRVTDMNDETGACSTTPTAFSGGLAPFDEELSVHIRGPFNLKQFAYYTPSSSSSKRDAHLHEHKRHAHKRYASASAAASSSSGTSWTRQSYYDSASGTANDVTFLNTDGGMVSGTWSTLWGSSLSYASSDGSQAAAEATVLEDCTIASTSEVVLFAGTSCESDDGCGYYRNGTVAYHGFGGASKVFLFEFGMPSGSGDNMPALWLLNAMIPRTQQYGSCSCWGNTDGCGELDVFETLDSGETRMTSSVHSTFAGGSSNYFTRPTSGTVKAAIVMNNNQVVISMLDSSFDISSELSASDYATLASPSGSTSVVLP